MARCHLSAFGLHVARKASGEVVRVVCCERGEGVQVAAADLADGVGHNGHA